MYGDETKALQMLNWMLKLISELSPLCSECLTACTHSLNPQVLRKIGPNYAACLLSELQQKQLQQTEDVDLPTTTEVPDESIEEPHLQPWTLKQNLLITPSLDLSQSMSTTHMHTHSIHSITFQKPSSELRAPILVAPPIEYKIVKLNCIVFFFFFFSCDQILIYIVIYSSKIIYKLIIKWNFKNTN